MSISEAQKRASAKYEAKAYEALRIRVKMGRKAEIEAHAKRTGESVNSFVNRAINQTMEIDNKL